MTYNLRLRATVWRAIFAGLFLFWTGIFIASCSPQGNTGTDGYQFEKKEWEAREIQVQLVPYTSVVEFKRAAARIGAVANDGGETRAFSEIRKGSYCRIHFVDPNVAYEPEWLGHELAHCAYGRWHEPGKSGAPL